MNGTPFYQMPVEEFIKEPFVIQLYAKDGVSLENQLKGLPYVRMGKRVRGDFGVLYVDSRRIGDLIDIVGTTFVELFPEALGLLGRASLQASGITQVQEHRYLNLRGRGTLVGIIDTGIDYANESFRYEDGTSRIRYIWDQSIEGKSPDGYFYGSEYTNEQINQALQSDNPYHFVPSADTVGHGTFLASVAAGGTGEEYIGAAPEAELLVVKLKRLQDFFYENVLIPEWQENAFSAVDVMLAIEYMIEKANELRMPLAISVGVGTNMSGNDGSSILSSYINIVSQITGICICTAAGNESSARHHTSGNLAERNFSYDISIRVPENADSFPIYIYVNPTDRMSVSVKSPLGETIPRASVESGAYILTRLVMENTSVRVQYYLPVSGSGAQVIAVSFLYPTPGIWIVTLHGDIILDGGFNAWLHITGLVTPGIEFVTPDPYTTIVTPGATPGCITCGAYNDKDNSLYYTSSWGTTRNFINKPDLTAPGVDVTGIFPTGPGTMTGTSVAAAITTGACALILQWGIVDQNDVSLNTNSIKAYLIRGCRRDQNIQYPSRQWGYGKLDLYNMFAQLF